MSRQSQHVLTSDKRQLWDARPTDQGNPDAPTDPSTSEGEGAPEPGGHPGRKSPASPATSIPATGHPPASIVGVLVIAHVRDRGVGSPRMAAKAPGGEKSPAITLHAPISPDFSAPLLLPVERSGRWEAGSRADRRQTGLGGLRLDFRCGCSPKGERRCGGVSGGHGREAGRAAEVHSRAPRSQARWAWPSRRGAAATTTQKAVGNG